MNRSTCRAAALVRHRHRRRADIPLHPRALDGACGAPAGPGRSDPWVPSRARTVSTSIIPGPLYVACDDATLVEMSSTWAKSPMCGRSEARPMSRSSTRQPAWFTSRSGSPGLSTPSIRATAIPRTVTGAGALRRRWWRRTGSTSFHRMAEFSSLWTPDVHGHNNCTGGAT